MATFATWNSADKGAGVTLSGGDLTATIASGGNAVRSTISKASGKWYWELNQVDASDSMNGVGNASAVLNNPPGQDTNGWGYFFNGQQYNNAILTAYGSSFTNGDVIGVALDADAGTVTFYKNNVAQPTITLTGVSSPYFAMWGGGGASCSVTANFGATALTYTPPGGFNAGLYDGVIATGGSNLTLLGVGT